MTKSQFNIKISKDLLVRVKRQAIRSGKSLTEHITDLVENSLANESIQNPDLSLAGKIKNLEDRLLSLESKVSNREYISKKLKPYTNPEGINCTKFMRGLFEYELKKRNYDDKNQAFDDFMVHLSDYFKSNQIFVDRLREVMLSIDPKPFTGKELNNMVGEDKCNCPIRKGLINWTGKGCPSQQEICDKGEKLLALF